MNQEEKEVLEPLHSCCQHYFVKHFQVNKFLYFDIIPHHYFGTEFEIVPVGLQFLWYDDPAIGYAKCKQPNDNFGKRELQLTQSCDITYQLKINGLFLPDTQRKKIKFFASTVEPFGYQVSPTIIEDELIVFDQFKKIKKKIKDSFSIQNIDEAKYKDDSIGFAFYAEITRKVRSCQPANPDIAHGYVYQEIANCHKEIEECVLNCLFHQKYLSDLLGRKYTTENKTIFFPNLSYNDFQYLIWAGFGFDRLYSFWDRLTYVLCNYNLLSFNIRNVSFDKYLSKIKNKIQLGDSVLFNPVSPSLQWLIQFHDNGFKELVDYRHRIVHYQITPSWDGVLSSKFGSNAMENSTDEVGLGKLKLEFERLGYLLHQQFNLCKEGFVNVLNLIDELA